MYSYTSWSHDSVVVLCNRGAPILWIDTCIFFWEVLLYYTLLVLSRQHGFQGSIIYDLIGWLFALPCRRDIVVVVFINCFIYLHFQTSIATGDRPTAASYNYEGKDHFDSICQLYILISIMNRVWDKIFCKWTIDVSKAAGLARPVKAALVALAKARPIFSSNLAV